MLPSWRGIVKFLNISHHDTRFYIGLRNNFHLSIAQLCVFHRPNAIRYTRHYIQTFNIHSPISGVRMIIVYYEFVISIALVYYSVHCESKKSPWWLVAIFPKRLGSFQPNFTCLLCVPIYARVRIFIQLLQLCRSYAILSATTQRALSMVDILSILWSSRLIWHNFVKVADNWAKVCSPAQMWTLNRHVKFGLKFSNRLRKMWENFWWFDSHCTETVVDIMAICITPVTELAISIPSIYAHHPTLLRSFTPGFKRDFFTNLSCSPLQTLPSRIRWFRLRRLLDCLSDF